MASVGLREIPEVVDSTAQGTRVVLSTTEVFLITLLKPWVN